MFVFSKIARTLPGLVLKRLIITVHVLYLLLMILLLGSAVFLPNIWILLLGSQYIAQEHLVWMAFLPAILMNGSGFAFTTLSARGITARQWTVIPLVIAAQIIFVYFIGVSNTFNALLFSIMTGSIYFASQYLILFFNFKNLIKIEGSK